MECICGVQVIGRYVVGGISKVKDMKVIGRTVEKRDLALFIFSRVGTVTKEITKVIYEMVTVNSNGQM
jgi:hypothetical protein